MPLFPRALAVGFVSLPLLAQSPLPAPLAEAREALSARQYEQARALYADYAAKHPEDARAPYGLGNVDLAEHRYEAAEIQDRKAVAIQPDLWPAHKDLVLIEAKLGRWEEFDRERAVLRGARERGAANITPQESDLIDSFDLKGKQWLVREYYVPVGRSETRYNFEHFTPEGKVEEYISLEPAAAATSALKRDEQVTIGKDTAPHTLFTEFALNWYTGKGHGTVRHYKQEPSYETLRADVRRWLSSQK
ncbi:MAG: hypothetical protein PW735_12135 [Acidobacteriaceae bacterium]|nr:hypothetical protein [Acidobacteriaceae bacterium]